MTITISSLSFKCKTSKTLNNSSLHRDARRGCLDGRASVVRFDPDIQTFDGS